MVEKREKRHGQSLQTGKSIKRLGGRGKGPSEGEKRPLYNLPLRSGVFFETSAWTEARKEWADLDRRENEVLKGASVPRARQGSVFLFLDWGSTRKEKKKKAAARQKEKGLFALTFRNETL